MPRKSKNLKRNSNKKTPNIKVKPLRPKRNFRKSKPKKSKTKENLEAGGLIINNKTVHSLSGPVSFYYLKPKNKIYRKGEGKNFPLIILFGDFHFSRKNYCFRCDCDNPKEYCCYNLSDRDFLNIIDNLASSYQIDFYAETFFGGTGRGFEGGMMHDFTTGDMINCYNTNLREKCPTKNIRWQAADARYSGVKQILLNKEDVKIDNIKSDKYLKNTYIEFQLNHLLNLLSMRNIAEFDDFLSKSHFNNIYYFKDFLLSLFDIEVSRKCYKNAKFKGFNTDRFSTKLFDMMTENNSLIKKQVKKQTFEDFNNIKTWEFFYNYLILGKLDFYLDGIKDDIVNDILNLEKIFYYPSYYLNDDLIYRFKSLRLALTVPLLDIYTVTRIFKKPVRGKRPDIAFCYFGNFHIENILDVLTLTDIYEIVVSKHVKYINDNDINRCLYLDDIKLDINKELLSHVKKCSKYSK